MSAKFDNSYESCLWGRQRKALKCQNLAVFLACKRRAPMNIMAGVFFFTVLSSGCGKKTSRCWLCEKESHNNSFRFVLFFFAALLCLYFFLISKKTSFHSILILHFSHQSRDSDAKVGKQWKNRLICWEFCETKAEKTLEFLGTGEISDESSKSLSEFVDGLTEFRKNP